MRPIAAGSCVRASGQGGVIVVEGGDRGQGHGPHRIQLIPCCFWRRATPKSFAFSPGLLEPLRRGDFGTHSGRCGSFAKTKRRGCGVGGRSDPGPPHSAPCATMGYFDISRVSCLGPGDRRRLTTQDGVPSWCRDCGQILRPPRACPPPGQCPLPGDSTTALARRAITRPTRVFGGILLLFLRLNPGRFRVVGGLLGLDAGLSGGLLAVGCNRRRFRPILCSCC